MILHPTETLYALGVNALDKAALARLYATKGREEGKAVSWLVRSVSDIARYGEVSLAAAKIAKRFLPGRLTLIVPVHEHIPSSVVAPDRTIGFRISSDPIAARVIADFMAKHDAPLTCTGANASGAPTLPTPSEILQQIGPEAHHIDTIINDGPRKGLASTVVRVIGDTVEVLREGDISEWDIQKALKGE